MSAKEDEYEKNSKKNSYLVDKKKYEPCLGCGTLIAPNDFGYDVAMCESCQLAQMKE
ncbi:hypothetical protein QG569_02815 [Weissella cibaria]|uniref:hypothetical protein n=1 Tax=Weissella cibaria TaxID=137591 RepID=UPI0015FD0FEA|nr:hypothetical protein [Weissella cibaria]MDK9677311.1 hypothetical protein [Weissella cibaria]